MAITVTGRGTSVTPALKDYVDEKIGRALEVFDRHHGRRGYPSR